MRENIAALIKITEKSDLPGGGILHLLLINESKSTPTRYLWIIFFFFETTDTLHIQMSSFSFKALKFLIALNSG